MSQAKLLLKRKEIARQIAAHGYARRSGGRLYVACHCYACATGRAAMLAIEKATGAA